jgi:peptide/nickel transport system substrate-binding protein
MRSSSSLLRRGVPIAAALTLAAGCSSTVAGNASFDGPSPTPTHTPSPTSSSPSTVSGGTATVGTVEFAQNFNPYSPSGDYGATYDIMPSVLPSVFTLTGANRYLPNTDLLTTDPSVTMNNGHMVVTYSLTPDAKWSDGTPIGVDDFKYLVQQAKQQKSKYAGPDYSSVSSVAKGSDDHHVEVTFGKADGDWRSLFSPLLPAHYAQQAGWESGFRNRIPVTAGPFRFSGSATSAVATLVKDPNYFGTKAHLDKIVFRSIPDPTAAAAATAAGELDAYYADPESSAIPSTATAVDGGYYTQLTFNVGKKPLNNVKVRQAIAFALGRDRIALIASPSTTAPSRPAGNNIFASGSHGGTQNDGAYPRQNPVQAQQLLRSAGYSTSKPLSLRLLTTNSDPARVQAGRLITAELSTIGIHLTLVEVPSNELFSTLLPKHQFDMALFSWAYSSTSAGAADILGCHGADNFSGYCNSNFDRLVGQSLAQPDLDQHNTLLNKADHQLWLDLPEIPLYQSKALVLVSPKLHGVAYNLSEYTLYRDTASWTKSP